MTESFFRCTTYLFLIFPMTKTSLYKVWLGDTVFDVAGVESTLGGGACLVCLGDIRPWSIRLSYEKNYSLQALAMDETTDPTKCKKLASVRVTGVDTKLVWLRKQHCTAKMQDPENDGPNLEDRTGRPTHMHASVGWYFPSLRSGGK